MNRIPLLLLCITIGSSETYAGDCVLAKRVTDPTLIKRFDSAITNCTDCKSQLYGNLFNLMVPKSDYDLLKLDTAHLTSDQINTLIADKPTIWKTVGDHKCGVDEPSVRSEFVSTKTLQNDYKQYLEQDLRLWVTSPKFESRVLLKPKSSHIWIKQSLFDCFKKGPDGFSCPKTKKRMLCCRENIAKKFYEAVYDHPFLPGTEIIVRDGEVTLKDTKSSTETSLVSGYQELRFAGKGRGFGYPAGE